MRKILIALAFLLISSTMFAVLPVSPPEKISYQAVVRNSSNALVTNQPVGVKISILQGSATGTPVFAETHTPTTNANGVINIAIGTGTVTSGSFAAIVWSTGPYFIKTEIDPAGGTAYSITATSELLSVPYALYAKKAESTNLLNLPFAGSSHSANNAFSVKNNNGIAIVGWGDATVGNTFGVIGSTFSGVGIGVSGINNSTTGLALGISGQTYSSEGVAVKGIATSSTGSATGVMGECQSTNGGIGVWGVGLTGVFGQSSNAKGHGVYGSTTSTTGFNTGVTGESASNAGYGVYGWANSTNGVNYGVCGISNSSEGYGVAANSPFTGVYGSAVAKTGESYGVRGRSHSNDGTGVFGENIASTGLTYGVRGVCSSPDGSGVYGEASNWGVIGRAYGTGYSNGVKGSSSSDQGVGVHGEAPTYGVFGKATLTTGATYGVQGETLSAQGYGVYGYSPLCGVFGKSGGTASGMGVLGEATANTSVGVYGKGTTTNSTGVWGEGYSHGVYGSSPITTGIGVYGVGTSNTGTNYGVMGVVASSTGYSGYFSGGKFYIKGRTGIGTQTPGAGLHLKGSGFPESFMYLEANTGQDAGFRLYEGTVDKWHIFNSVGAGGLQIYNNGGITAIFCKQDNSNVGIGTITPGYKLQVGNSGDGTQARANAWNTFSDARLKKDFSDIDDPLEMVDKLNGYYYYWKDGTDRSRQVGFSAQEIRRIMPEVVSEGHDGLLSVEYGKMAPLLLEAIKALKTENDQLKTENSQLKAASEKNETRMTEIEKMLRDLMKK